MRFLLILEKGEEIRPKDAEKIAALLRSHYPHATVRVASGHVEITVVGGLEEDLLRGVGLPGAPLAVRRLGEKGEEDLRELVTSERFWEAHELLEGLWRQERGERRGRLERAIKLLAALAKAQEGKPGAAREILRRGGLEELGGELVAACFEGDKVGERAWELLERELSF